jgi:hypothetical protein
VRSAKPLTTVVDAARASSSIREVTRTWCGQWVHVAPVSTACSRSDAQPESMCDRGTMHTYPTSRCKGTAAIVGGGPAGAKDATETTGTFADDGNTSVVAPTAADACPPGSVVTSHSAAHPSSLPPAQHVFPSKVALDSALGLASGALCTSSAASSAGSNADSGSKAVLSVAGASVKDSALVCCTSAGQLQCTVRLSHRSKSPGSPTTKWGLEAGPNKCWCLVRGTGT